MPETSKSLLRKDMKAVLTNLDPRWTAAASHRVAHNLLQLFTNLSKGQIIEAVLGYAPCFPGEIDISYFFSLIPAASRKYLPMLEEDGSMHFIEIDVSDFSSLSAAPFVNATSDKTGQQFELALAPWSIVLVPGLAFSRNGARLGRGRGHYDTFLGGDTRYISVGVCWEFQLVDNVPVEPQDQFVDWICTENEFFPCRAKSSS